MDTLQQLDVALDEASYDWLEANNPAILAGVEQGIKDGATPAAILRRVLIRTGREDLARRCEQAARHVARSQRQTVRAKVGTGSGSELIDYSRRDPQLDG